MKELKISNELLSAVLGCECEFVTIREYKGFNRPTYLNLEYETLESGCETIPLDFFIHIAVDEWALDKLDKDIAVFPMFEDNKKHYYFNIFENAKSGDVKLGFGSGEEIMETKREAFIKALELLV